MPPGFEPIAFRPPLWLHNGREIAVVGARDGRMTLIEFSGPSLQQQRILAADRGPWAPDGTLKDIAVNPDSSSVAIAVARPAPDRLEVIRLDLANGEGRSIASLGGSFESVSVGWRDPGTVALGLRELPAESSADAPRSGAANAATSSIYLIPANGIGTPERIQLSCTLSPMSWSPDGAYGVGQGDDNAPAVLVDLQKKSCRSLSVLRPIRVLDWAPKAGAFIYVVPLAGGIPVGGSLQFDIASRETAPVAVSSSAAAYVTDSAILALGNSQLSLRRVLDHPRVLITTEVALVDSKQRKIEVAPLGIRVFPDMLASSAMTYSPRSETAAIELFSPGSTGPIRYVIAYSMATRRATLLASGPSKGLALLSWSPQQDLLALLDGDSSASALTILALVPATASNPEFVPPPASAPKPPTL